MPADTAGIERFRGRGGGGVITDHYNLGVSVLRLRDLGVVNHFHDRHPEPGRRHLRVQPGRLALRRANAGSPVCATGAPGSSDVTFVASQG